MPQKSKTRSSKRNNQKNSLQTLIEKWIAPIILTLVLGAVSWLFFTRLDRVEILATNLDHTVSELKIIVGELDKNYSRDSETKGTYETDMNKLKTDVEILKVEINNLKN
jgi:cell division protein FtsB